MPYKIHKHRKVVDVVGAADLDAIVGKVRKAGGKGWVIKAFLSQAQVESIASRIEIIQEPPQVRPIGFRVAEYVQEAEYITGLPFSPPDVTE
jgi:hypothetical protein